MQTRHYVRKEGRTLHAEPLGCVLSAFLEAYFDTYVDYGFTSRMEGQLDDVSAGQIEWKVGRRCTAHCFANDECRLGPSTECT